MATTLPDPSTVLPTNADPTLASQANPLTAQYGSAAISPQLTSNVQSNATSNINPGTLNTQPITIPPVKSSNTNDFVQSLNTGVLGTTPTQTLQQNVQTAQAGVDKTTSEIQQLMQQLGYRSQDVTNLQQSTNIGGLSQNLSDLNTQYAQKKAQYDLAQQKIATQPLETGYILGQSGILQANRAVELGSLAAQIQAAQGNLNTAFNTINQTLEQKYKPIIQQLDAKQQFYQLNKDRLTQAQARLATREAAVVQAQAAQAQNRYKIDQEATTQLGNLAKSGFIDPQTAFSAMADIASGKKTPEQISNELGVSINGIQGTGNLADAISSVESGGNYTSIGPVITSGQNKGYSALGKYQIMPNLWFSSIGLDPNNKQDIQKFLNTPSLQDQLFKNIIDNLQQKYSTPQQAIAAYFGGDAGAKAYGTPAGDKISDGNMTINQYVNAVMKNLGGITKPGLTGSSDINAGAPGYTSKIVPNSGQLTQAQIDQEAINRLSGGAPNLGKGTSGLSGVQNRAITARMSEIDPTGNLAANKAQLKSLSSSLANQQKALDKITVSLNNADQGFQKLLSTFQGKGLNDSIPISNAIENKVRYGLGDGDVAALKSGLAEVSTEYAQVLARNGQLTVADKQKADDILNGNLSLSSMQKILDVVHNQGEINKQNAQNQVNSINKQIQNLGKGNVQTPSNVNLSSLNFKVSK